MWPVIGAVISAYAASQQQGASSTQTRNVGAPTKEELSAQKDMQAALEQYRAGAAAGPGQNEIMAAQGSNKSLQDLLAKYAGGGFMPSQEDTNAAQTYAQSQFAPQQVGLQQGFQGQQQRAAQLASQLGRPVNDPIIQAKLSQEYSQGQERLGAAQEAFATQTAQNMPMQRLGYTAQLADVNNQLASQAMANRQMLFNMGNQVVQGERNMRLGQSSVTTTQSGGGNPIAAGLAGYGAFANLANSSRTPSEGGPQTFGNQNMQQPQSTGSYNPFSMGGGGGAQPQADQYTGNTFTSQYAYPAGPGMAPSFSTQSPTQFGNFMQDVGNPNYTPQFGPPQMPRPITYGGKFGVSSY